MKCLILNWAFWLKAIVDDPSRLDRCVNNIRLVSDGYGCYGNDAETMFLALSILSRVVANEFVKTASPDDLIYMANELTKQGSAGPLDDPRPLMEHPWLAAIVERRPDFKKLLREIAKVHWAKAGEEQARLEIENRLVGPAKLSII